MKIEEMIERGLDAEKQYLMTVYDIRNKINFPVFADTVDEIKKREKEFLNARGYQVKSIYNLNERRKT